MDFGGPQSPVDMKPDAAALAGMVGAGSPAGNFSEMGSPGGPNRPSSPNANYPPLSGSKHFCAICGDRASGKHYGVYSCEGCKGFFKRTVRKELTYACRENQQCLIDKRQRNRCQYCRYMKCLRQGMRREAVQEERHRANSNGSGGRDSRDGRANDLDGMMMGDLGSVGGADAIGGADMPLDRIIEAENRCDAAFHNERTDGPSNVSVGAMSDLSAQPTRELLQQLIDWAKRIPHFSTLRTEDQATLIRAGWNELLISSFAFRSTEANDTIMWANGKAISRESAHLAGLGDIFDRILVELIGKMKELKMDMAELGCLRAIVLFNPDAKGLDMQASIMQVESFREKVYATLEEYCRVKYGDADHGRFAKLLLRLPALRSIGLKCVEQLFFYKLIKDADRSGAVDSEDAARNLEIFIKESLEDD